MQQLSVCTGQAPPETPSHPNELPERPLLSPPSCSQGRYGSTAQRKNTPKFLKLISDSSFLGGDLACGHG